MNLRSYEGACLVGVLLPVLVVLNQCGERSKEAGEDAVVSQPEGKSQPVTLAGSGGSFEGANFQSLSQGINPTYKSAREFSPLSDEQRHALELLTAEFWKSEESDRRLEILDEIELSLYGPDILGFIEKVIGLEDDVLSARALELLDGNIDPAIIPLLEKAFQGSSEEIREIAASAASQVRDDSLVGYFEKVFADPSANVQLRGLDSIDGQVENRRVKILALALRSPLPEVQTFVIDLIQLTATRQSVEVVFDALDAADPEVRDAARFSLDFMLNQEFSSAAEAREWWKENRNKFDNDLAPAE